MQTNQSQGGSMLKFSLVASTVFFFSSYWIFLKKKKKNLLGSLYPFLYFDVYVGLNGITSNYWLAVDVRLFCNTLLFNKGLVLITSLIQTLFLYPSCVTLFFRPISGTYINQRRDHSIVQSSLLEQSYKD